MSLSLIPDHFLDPIIAQLHELHLPEEHVRQVAPCLFASPFFASVLLHDEQARNELCAGVWSQAYDLERMQKELNDLVVHTSDEQALMAVLRQFRRRQMARIAWRDMRQIADVSETLLALSDLADTCIDTALSWHHQHLVAKYGEPIGRDSGQPQRLVVVGMGKLGGQELNYSSDVDLIFAYPEPGQTNGDKVVDNERFFTRLGQALIASLDQLTADGFVFRVDMRLRPFGDSGSLVMHFEQIENYYQNHGREWERYAWIKARALAGDLARAPELMQSLMPFVFRRYLDFGAIAELREMKASINKQRSQEELAAHLKLGPGGIREIEFIAQSFQLIRGGREQGLQQRSVLAVLAHCGQMGLLPDYAVQQLVSAYQQLRRYENGVQMMRDQQTHRLPNNEEDRLRLTVLLRYPSIDAMLENLAEHREAVSAQFEQVFAETDSDNNEVQQQVRGLWVETDEQRGINALEAVGYDDAQAAWQSLQSLRELRSLSWMSSKGQERLQRLMPLLFGVCAGLDQPTLALQRSLKMIASIARRSVYLSLLAEHPLVLSQFVRLAEASPWIADLLARQPLLLDELLNPQELYQPLDHDELVRQLDVGIAEVSEGDLEQFMEVLRQFKSVQTLRVAAADVLDKMPLMKVSDQLTWIAEAIVSRAQIWVWKAMEKKHGKPSCVIDAETKYPLMCVVAYGKLGGLEMGYGSDLDIVFLHNSRGERQVTEGDKSIDNAVFFSRLAQKVIHVLTALTPSGALYEVDTRLRPNGASGLLVSSLEAFERYQQEQAWTWEHQALVRARAISGSQELMDGFTALRQRVLCVHRDVQQLKTDVRQMREKMIQALGGKQAGEFNVKKDSGGIADIEFMVQYMVLAHAAKHPELIAWMDNNRLLGSLAAVGLIDAIDADTLANAYRDMRNKTHALALQDRLNVVHDDSFAAYRELVCSYWQRWIES